MSFGTKAEKHVLNVINHGPLPMVWCALPEWQIICYSQRFTENFGYDIHDIPDLDTWFLKAYPDEAYRNELRSRWGSYIVDALQSGCGIPDFEVRIRIKDGTFRELIISTAIIDDHALVSFMDVTSLKATEHRLQDTEHRYQRLFENMTSGFALHEMIYDQSGQAVDYRYLEANPAFHRLTGIDPAGLVGHTVRELMPDTEDYWIQTYAQVAETGEVLKYRNFAQAIGRWFDTYSFSPQRGQFAVVFNDITDEIMAQEEVQRLNSELEQRIVERTAELEFSTRQLMESEKLAGLGALVAGIAHEVNTPLGTAFTAASYLQEITKQVNSSSPTPMAANIQEGMDIIMRNLDRASGIIKSFRQFSADQSSGQNRDFILKDLVNDVVTSLHPRLKKSGVTVSVDLPDLLHFHGPAGDLSQVFTNLIMNAMDHGITPDFPHIDIRISACHEENWLVMEVGNNGAPIPEGIRSRIFEPFFTTRRSTGGTGLGLSIVNSIVTQRCQGTLECLPGGQQGVRFLMRFPLGPQQPIRSLSPLSPARQ